VNTAGAFKMAVLIAGVLIGAWQSFISLQTIFVMRDEWLLLVALIIGPLSIIPAVVVSIWKPRLSGWWLISGGIALSGVVALHSGVEAVQIQTALFLYSLPMMLLGVGFVLVAKLGSASKALSGNT
jgi:hypothetical protein